MAWFSRRSLVILFSLVLALSQSNLVQAARGVPGSPEFGIGAILYPNGPLVKEALEAAADLDLDWLSVPVDWSACQPERGVEPNLAALAPVMQFAEQQQVAVLVSLRSAPDWAKTAQGPDPVESAQFAALLVRRYPRAIQALEVFPGANTRSAWGAEPSPQAYNTLFQQTLQAVRDVNAKVVLVAAGLVPLGAKPANGDIDDLEFLTSLYRLGAAKSMPVISLQYADLTGDPLAFPEGSEHRVFRHYEEVRRVMTANQHKSGLLWITRFSPPSGKIGASDAAFHDINAQVSWMSQAYIQARSQLYVGMTIGMSLNPESEGAAAGVLSLLQNAGEHHPFYSVLGEMINLNQAGSDTMKPGKPKEGSFPKKRP